MQLLLGLLGVAVVLVLHEGEFFLHRPTLTLRSTLHGPQLLKASSNYFSLTFLETLPTNRLILQQTPTNYYNISNWAMIARQILCLLSLLACSLCYLDISLQITREGDSVSYQLPIAINQVPYGLQVSMKDASEFIVPLPHKNMKAKKKHKTQNSMKDLTGVIKATSLEGYSFEGWKRFFMEALLYIQSRYYHEVTVNMSEIQRKVPAEDLSFQADGLISFGPALGEHKFFQLVKSGNEYTKYNVVSIYRGVNDDSVRMQLGGYEQSFARGLSNGILFYELDLQASQGRWWLPVQSVSCLHEKNGKDDVFYISNSGINLAIDIESAVMKLPTRFASQIERYFQTPHTSCRITERDRLACTNMTSVDLSLNFIQFKIDQWAYVNISLYDLRGAYNEHTKETEFFVEFVPSSNDFQIGESLFKSYYVSIDIENKKMLYSRINHFPSESYGVYIIRFMIGFGIFTIAAAFAAMLWQKFNDPFTKNKMMYGHEGVKLVSYTRPNDIEE